MINMHFKGFLNCSNRRPESAINGVFALNKVESGPNKALDGPKRAKNSVCVPKILLFA